MWGAPEKVPFNMLLSAERAFHPVTPGELEPPRYGFLFNYSILI